MHSQGENFIVLLIEVLTQPFGDLLLRISLIEIT